MSKIDYAKMDGLVPAVIQDCETLEVLMLGFMNEEAVKKTLEDGKVTFFSRSKNRLWQKGESSGNFLKVVDVQIDCDEDTLLIMADPAGPTCHTGERTCFGEKFDLLTLYKLIKKRKKEMPEKSYTTSLFEEGLEKILEKVEEESEEVLRAARLEGKQRLVEESCDLLYHLMVLWANEGVGLGEINEEFRKRHQ